MHAHVIVHFSARHGNRGSRTERVRGKANRDTDWNNKNSGNQRVNNVFLSFWVTLTSHPTAFDSPQAGVALGCLTEEVVEKISGVEVAQHGCRMRTRRLLVSQPMTVERESLIPRHMTYSPIIPAGSHSTWSKRAKSQSVCTGWGRPLRLRMVGKSMWCGLWFVISPLVQLKNKPITKTDWPWMQLVVITKRCSTDRLVALLAEKLSSWNPDCMHGVIMISCIHLSA